MKSEDIWNCEITDDEELAKKHEEAMIAEIEEEEDEDLEKYDSPENLVFETINVESRSSMQVNLTKLLASHVIVGEWSQVKTLMN